MKSDATASRRLWKSSRLDMTGVSNANSQQRDTSCMFQARIVILTSSLHFGNGWTKWAFVARHVSWSTIQTPMTLTLILPHSDQRRISFSGPNFWRTYYRKETGSVPSSHRRASPGLLPILYSIMSIYFKTNKSTRFLPILSFIYENRIFGSVTFSLSWLCENRILEAWSVSQMKKCISYEGSSSSFYAEMEDIN